MIEINWGIFRAKFNGKEQKSFEDLCYILFCNEFNKPYGIDRLKNHPGIETHPIEVDGKWIGFQSKFSPNTTQIKSELIGSIDKARSRNPEISSIRFYLSEDFSSSSQPTQKDPKYKVEVEEHAKNNGIEIDWRTASHFDSEFVRITNKEIARHFFTYDQSVIDAITELHHHTRSVFDSIKSEIKFGNISVKSNKSQQIKDLKDCLDSCPVVIISGEGGVGKTAVIKDFYESSEPSTSIFLFKATQFAGIQDVNGLLPAGITWLGLFKEYANAEQKYIVIDSAEKLSDLENQNIFKELLSSALKERWKIIFTTRHAYLDDLRSLLRDCGIFFQNINITTLEEEEIKKLSTEYSFELPTNQNILSILRNPFYLNEYLSNELPASNLSEFKKSLWNRRILKSGKNNLHKRIEDCFLRIAQKRANEGKFYIDDDGDNEALQSLQHDEIIKYESGAGYFIVHDIYEEWALEKIIEKEFVGFTSNQNFFQKIGNSLPIRRAFRSWLSEKLLSSKESVKSFISEAISDINIDSHWKDEVLVSVLLSSHCDKFFELFDSELKRNDQKLLFRIIFLLQTACKEIDESLLRNLLIQKHEEFDALDLLLTRPKGSGWDCLMAFLHSNQDIYGVKYIQHIIPILREWNAMNFDGETTKRVSKIALNYYNELTKNEDTSWRHSDVREELAKIILNGASEVKEELGEIFDKIRTGRSERYYDFVKLILANKSPNAIKALPIHTIKLANLFWTYEEDPFKSHGLGLESSINRVEHSFGISDTYDFKYHPSSALQTPIFQLLYISPLEAVNFILSFVNKAAETCASSQLDYVEQIKIKIDDNKTVDQFISNRLWNAFRGTQVSTNLLESLHMALERWLLLIVAKNVSNQNFENWCLYLLKNSKSASITAVVASVVMAHPFKLFNIAKILIRTKELFSYDRARALFDINDSRFLLGFSNPGDELYTNERRKACEDEHRKLSLESLILDYQIRRDPGENDDEVNKRNKCLHAIIDEYYKFLPDESLETDEDKSWRLALARMDMRRMGFEKVNIGQEKMIRFVPKIDQKLQQHSKDALSKIEEEHKYSNLKLWSQFRFERDKKYEKYKYDQDSKLVIKEIKEVLQRLSGDEENFAIMYKTIPSYACAVLLRDFFDNLTEEEKNFCKDQILECALLPFVDGYFFQISDAAQPSILSLELIMKFFPKEKKSAKSLLFLLLFNPWKESRFSAIEAVKKLWESNFDDAHAFFIGYLCLKPKYDALLERLRKSQETFRVSKQEIIEKFEKENKEELDSVINNTIKYQDLNLEIVDIKTMITTFELLPLNITNSDQKKFLDNAFPIFARKLFSDIDDDIKHEVKSRFLTRLTTFILNADKAAVLLYLKPFIDNFRSSSGANDFLKHFAITQDGMGINSYENFWIIWNALFDKMVETHSGGTSYYFHQNIKYYLLAQYWWKRNAKDWHSLKDRERVFYKNIASSIGHHPSVFYSIVKVLNDIGSAFADDGIIWVSDILQKNNMLGIPLETDTLYYLEIFIKKFHLKNRQAIKKSSQLKKRVISILNFLVESGSAKGYLLREDIL